jgi:hypothetical protein
MDYTEGAHVVHFPTKHSFRIYVALSAHVAKQVSAAMAEDYHWVISFIGDSGEVEDAQDPVVSSSGTINGNFFAVPGTFAHVLCAHVPAAGFADVPVFISSLSVHCFFCYGQVTGAATIYRPSMKGFRLYLRNPATHTELQHRALPWSVNYLAFDGELKFTLASSFEVKFPSLLTCASLCYHRLYTGAQFTLDCMVSGWSLFSACSKTCDSGTQLRNRTIIQQPRSSGAPCPPLLNLHKCNTQPCREC